MALLLALSLATGLAAPSTAALSDLWPFGRKVPAPAVPDPVTYAATLSVSGADSRLEKNLRNASDVLKLQATPASGLTGLLARARQDVARLTGVLYENARYAAEVSVLIDGRPLQSVGPFDNIAARPVPVSIRITVGPPFVFGRVSTTTLPPGVDLNRIGLVAGKPAGSAVILNAEAAIADGWRKNGHPLVQVEPRDTVADHRADRLDVALNVEPGPLANFGRVTVTGTKEVNADLVLARSGIQRGTQYSSDITSRAENRLRDLGVFDSVRAIPGETLDPDGTIPVTITVSERPKHVIGGSVTFSNTEGLGVSAFWRNRNLFGNAEQLEITGGVSRLLEGALDPDFRFATTFRKPAVLDPLTDFTLTAQVYRETTDTYRSTAAEGDVGLSHIFSDTLTGAADFDLTRSRTTTFASGTTEDHLIATVSGKLDWDTRDNKLDPSSGFRAELMAAPAYDFLQHQPFATFHTDFATYRGFGDANQFVLAGRVAADVLTVDDINTVAADRRIYAGGAGSVRGYPYKSLGPTDGSGNVIGGRSAFTVSGEIRYRVNDQFGLVGFVDAGNAFASILPSFDGLRVGAGVGIRYLTPIGPIRLDLAMPLTRRPGDPSFELYVGLGQAF
ncbi:MAG TPA: autotransporter assembly complex family protein [Bauldia sp.]|nr:autotransporter assembly complex family protein [Bauldia sp.]